MLYIGGCKPVISVTFLKISVINICPKRRDTIAIIVIYMLSKNSCNLILSQYIVLQKFKKRQNEIIY